MLQLGEGAAIDRQIAIDGVAVPRLVYGTAWKEDATEGLVTQALANGFRGIDTANQRKHYFEAGWGRRWPRPLPAGRSGAKVCFCRPSSPFCAARIIACRTTPRRRPCPGRAVVRKVPGAPGHGLRRFLRSARPVHGWAPDAQGLAGLARDGGDPCLRPGAIAGRQ